MVAFEPFEELHFAGIIRQGKYAIVHSIFDGKILSPGKSQYMVDLSYNEFCRYLEGASFGKDGVKLHLFNGIPNLAAYEFFPSSRLSCVKKIELEKILKETGLNKEFKDKIMTVRN